jgi:hydrogenase small subunit
MTRREFLRLAGISAGVVGFSALDLSRLERALADPLAPTVIWLQGASCTGCSVSLLNRISTTGPTDIGDLLINYINLSYHPQVMALAGQSAVQQAQKAYAAGNYVLAVEGGIPTAFGGNTCWAWSYNGKDVTMLEAVKTLSSKALAVLSVGTCAAFGGIPAAPPNPTGIKSVSAVTGKKTINIAGCPTHPDWIVWTVAQLLIGNTIQTDANGRPTALFNRTVHSQCPRREADETGRFGVEGACLEELGCKGPSTIGPCPKMLFNGGANWCIGANAPCLGCTEPSFPAATGFYRGGEGGGDDDEEEDDD